METRYSEDIHDHESQFDLHSKRTHTHLSSRTRPLLRARTTLAERLQPLHGGRGSVLVVIKPPCLSATSWRARAAGGVWLRRRWRRGCRDAALRHGSEPGRRDHLVEVHSATLRETRANHVQRTELFEWKWRSGGAYFNIICTIFPSKWGHKILALRQGFTRLCVRDMQTSPTLSSLHCKLYLAKVRPGEAELQPLPKTKNGCSRSASTVTCERERKRDTCRYERMTD